MAKIDVKKIDARVLGYLKGAQFVPEEPVYEQSEVLLTVPSGDYEVTSKLIGATAGNKPWTAYEAKFRIGKEDYVIQYRSKVMPDEDADMVICLFVANRDFTTSSGKLIPKGKEKVFAINAA